MISELDINSEKNKGQNNAKKGQNRYNHKQSPINPERSHSLDCVVDWRRRASPKDGKSDFKVELILERVIAANYYLAHVSERLKLGE